MADSSQNTKVHQQMGKTFMCSLLIFAYLLWRMFYQRDDSTWGVESWYGSSWSLKHGVDWVYQIGRVLSCSSIRPYSWLNKFWHVCIWRDRWSRKVLLIWCRVKKLNDLWRVNLLNVNSMQWERIYPKGVAPEPRHGHTMSSLRNLLVVFGGMNQKKQLLSDIVIYNSISNEW